MNWVSASGPMTSRSGGASPCCAMKGADGIVKAKAPSRSSASSSTHGSRTGRLIRQKIKLEPIDSPTLFGIRPMLDASSVYQQIQPSLQHQRRHAVSV